MKKSSIFGFWGIHWTYGPATTATQSPMLYSLYFQFKAVNYILLYIFCILLDSVGKVSRGHFLFAQLGRMGDSIFEMGKTQIMDSVSWDSLLYSDYCLRLSN